MEEIVQGSSGNDQKERKAMLDSLPEKLDEFYESKVHESLQRKADLEELSYNVVHKIIRKVHTVDSRFRPTSLLSLGMPYEGVHGDDNRVTEFEMMIQLSLGINNSLYVHREKNGRVVRIQPVTSNLWQDCMEENSMFISPKRVTRVLRQYVKRTVHVLRKYLDAGKKEKLPDGLRCLELEDERFKIVLRINNDLRVTLLPAVSIPDSRIDMTRKDLPSTSHVVAMLQEDEQHVEVLDENNNAPSPPIIKMHNQNKHIKLHWQYSFFVAERNKMRTISDGCRSKLLRIITEIRDRDITLAGLSPYHLQTMFFYEVDRVSRRRDWKETKMASRFVDFLRAISKHLERGVCTNYFMNPPDFETINLFDDLRLEDMRAMKCTIDSYIENPLGCLKM